MQDIVFDSTAVVNVPSKKQRGKSLMKVRRFHTKMPYGLMDLNQKLLPFSLEFMEAEGIGFEDFVDIAYVNP